jgi:hypothetical protein
MCLGRAALSAPARWSGERLCQLREHVHRRRERWFLTFDQRGIERHAVVAPEDLEGGLAADAQWTRPLERSVQLHAEQIVRAALQLQLGVEVGDEVQRHKLHEHVEADVAFHAEPGGACVERGIRAEFHRVRGDG